MDSLYVDGLCKTYPGFALQDIRLAVAPGQIMGLIGRNGAGKSTLIKAILGMVHPDKGEVKLFGEPLSGQRTALRERLGVVVGDRDVYPAKRLCDISRVIAPFYSNWDNLAFEGYLKRFGIDPSKRMADLSTGMKVKYKIAVALSHQAELFILDEPTSGLDPVARSELLAIFKALVKGGRRSVLFSTHITTDLEACADAIAYLRQGQLVRCDAIGAFIHHFEAITGIQPMTLDTIMTEWEGDANDRDAFV